MISWSIDWKEKNCNGLMDVKACLIGAKAKNSRNKKKEAKQKLKIYF